MDSGRPASPCQTDRELEARRVLHIRALTPVQGQCKRPSRHVARHCKERVLNANYQPSSVGLRLRRDCMHHFRWWNGSGHERDMQQCSTGQMPRFLVQPNTRVSLQFRPLGRRFPTWASAGVLHAGNRDQCTDYEDHPRCDKRAWRYVPRQPSAFRISPVQLDGSILKRRTTVRSSPRSTSWILRSSTKSSSPRNVDIGLPTSDVGISVSGH